jgi:hypothetical protein
MAVRMKFRVFWDIAPCSHVEVDQNFRGAYCLVMEAVHTSETSVNFNMTMQRYIPEDSKLQQIVCSLLTSKSLSYSHYSKTSFNQKINLKDSEKLISSISAVKVEVNYFGRQNYWVEVLPSLNI